MGHLGTSVPGFCTEFRYLSYGQSGLAWGDIFEKSPKIKKIHFFKKWTCPKNPEMSFSRKKAAGGPMQETQPEAFKNTGIYIYMIPPEKSHMAPYEITLFYRNLKK